MRVCVCVTSYDAAKAKRESIFRASTNNNKRTVRRSQISLVLHAPPQPKQTKAAARTQRGKMENGNWEKPRTDRLCARACPLAGSKGQPEMDSESAQLTFFFFI